jgi:hypothetical protein
MKFEFPKHVHDLALSLTQSWCDNGPLTFLAAAEGTSAAGAHRIRMGRDFLRQPFSEHKQDSDVTQKKARLNARCRKARGDYGVRRYTVHRRALATRRRDATKQCAHKGGTLTAILYTFPERRQTRFATEEV